MNEISEKADRLVSVYSTEAQVCGADWREPWDKKLAARKRLEDYIASLESQLAAAQARLAAFEEGYDPITTLARGCKQVLVKFKDGYAGEPSEFMIVRVNRKGEICDGAVRWFPLPGSKEEK